MKKTVLKDLKNKLVRPTSRAIVGGFRPPADPFASWFGKVCVAAAGEDWPTSAGRPMMPLCQFNLAETPFCPESLSDIAFLTIFIDQEALPISKPNGDGWLLRAYPSTERLISLAPPASQGFIKPFPVRWELIEQDFPCWEDAQDAPLPPEVEENYHDFFQNTGGTKVGGWPTLIQAGLGMATTRQALTTGPQPTMILPTRSTSYRLTRSRRLIGAGATAA